jgi:glycosyltransferase involved in cell wall biosynthesis
MRVLFVSDNFPPESNAPASRLHEHARRWVRAGHQVTVITCTPNFPEGRPYAGYDNRWRQVEELDGIRVVRVKTYMAENRGVVRRTLDHSSFMLTSVLAGAIERRPDVVVATSPQFFAGLAGYQLARRWRAPFVLEVRDLWPASISAVGAMRDGPLLRALERLELSLYARASAVVVVTEAFRADLVARGVAESKIHVIPNGADLDWCRPGVVDEELRRQHGWLDKFVVGYIGTLGMAHGLERVLDAAELVRDTPNVAFFLAGAGAERARLEARLSRASSSNVRLLPRQPKARVSALWGACDVTLITLAERPLFASVVPSKLFEAMGHGVPVVMSVPEGEATALVRREGCGVVVPVADPHALAEVIRELARSPERVAELRALSLAAAPRHSREQHAAHMLALLERIATARAADTSRPPRRPEATPWTR